MEIHSIGDSNIRIIWIVAELLDEILILVGKRRQVLRRRQDMKAISGNLGGTVGSRSIADIAASALSIERPPFSGSLTIHTT